MNIRKTLSMTVVLAMLCSPLPAGMTALAYANNENLIIPSGAGGSQNNGTGQLIVTPDSGTQKTGEAENVEVTGVSPAVEIRAEGEGTVAEAKVEEGVSETNTGDTAGVSIEATDGGSSSAEIGSDVTVSGQAENVEAASTNGIYAASDGGTVETTVGGDVNVSGEYNGTESASITGISAVSKGTDSSTGITVEGDVNVSSVSEEVSFEGTYGIYEESSGDGSTAEVSVGKSVTVQVQSSGEDSYQYVTGVSVNSGNEFGETQGTAKVTVGEDVNVTVSSDFADLDAFGVAARSDDEGSRTEVQVGGSVSVHTNNGSSYGVSAGAINGGAVDVTIGNGVTLSVEEEGHHLAVDANAQGEGSQVDLTVTGNVTLGGTKKPVNDDYDENTDPSAAGEPDYSVEDAALRAIVGDGGVINISINEGNIIGSIEMIPAAENEGNPGSAEAGFTGTGVVIEDQFDSVTGTVTVRVEDRDGEDESTGEFFDNGNISGGDTGLQVILNENSETTVNVVASGTISGGYTPVMVNENVTEDNLKLTVWEIVPTETADGEKHVVQTLGKTDEGMDIAVSTETTRKIEESIRYIIKVEANENAVLTTGGTTEYEGYNVAREGDRVTLKINASDGYFIEGAYNGLGERIPLQYANGEYYIDVPRGGGVYLSARIGKHGEEVKEEKTVMKEQPQVTVTFDLNGGKLKNQTGVIEKKIRNLNEFYFAEAEKEGAVFKCWRDKNTGEEFRAGTKYKVRGAVSFMAIWE